MSEAPHKADPGVCHETESLARWHFTVATEVRQEAGKEDMQERGIAGAIKVERLSPPVVPANHPASRTTTGRLTATAIRRHPLAALDGYPIRSLFKKRLINV